MEQDRTDTMSDDINLFASMSFKGERFNGKFIPVDALPAIHSYQETLIQMAKTIWYEENPESKKLPNSFAKSFELGLRGIGDGSKIAYLPRREVSPDQLFADTPVERIFIEAQERIANTVIAANQNRDIAPLPETVIAPMERILRSLSSSEHINVDPIAEGKRRFGSFQISERSIAKIAERSRVRQNKRIDGVGFVVGVSEAPPTIKVMSASGVFLYPIAWEDLRANPLLSIGSVVAFAINVEVNAIGEITRFLSPEAISAVTTTSLGERLQSRINEYIKVEAGWLDGSGAAPSKKTLLRSLDLSVYFGRVGVSASVFMHEEGGIQFEWVDEMIASSLLVEGDCFLLGSSDLNSDRFREKTFKGISYALLRAITHPKNFVG